MCKTVGKDYRHPNGSWGKFFRSEGVKYTTKMNMTWYAMQERCKKGGSVQKRESTYVGCSIADEFMDYQKFGDWYSSQVGYGAENYDLDKDILFKGNKVYSSSTCVLIPRELNRFFGHNVNGGNKYQQGVYWHSRDLVFQTQILVDGKIKYLGRFTTPESCYATYKAAKESEARRWYKRLCSGEFIVDPRVIERMRTWTME